MFRGIQLIALLSFLLPIGSFGQSYIPLLGTDSTKWCVGISEFESGYSINYVCKGDTLVNGVEYHPLYRYCKTPLDNSDLSLIGLLREDTIEQQVFLIEAGDSIEFILYDFSLTLGDSIFLLQPFHYCGNYTDTLGWYVVSLLDTTQTISGDKKYIRLDPLHHVPYWFNWLEWIEGVGIYQGAYLSDSCTNGFNNLGYTDRKYNDTTLVYYHLYPHLSPPETACSCEIFDGITDKVNNSLVRIYPVPAEQILIIKTEGNLIADLRVFNLFGELMTYSTLSEEKSLDISMLPNGVYFLEISNERYRVFKKFIKC